MSWNSETAVRYLERADELRCIAKCMKAGETRQKLLRVAADYERMARGLIKNNPEQVPREAPTE